MAYSTRNHSNPPGNGAPEDEGTPEHGNAEAASLMDCLDLGPDTAPGNGVPEPRKSIATSLQQGLDYIISPRFHEKAGHALRVAVSLPLVPYSAAKMILEIYRRNW